MSNSPHIPVLLNEMLEYMSPKDGEIYVDGTFGAGGYSKALLKAANCMVYGIDRDPSVKVMAAELQKEFPGRIDLLLGKFSEMEDLLAEAGIPKVNGIVLDVGVSSMQIDQPERGFSFMQNGRLDMRMGEDGIDAAYVVNHTPEKELADIIYKYGGERKSRRVARAIVAARVVEPITTTRQLANIVRSVVRASKDKIDPATRTFQALRIWVNDELGELQKALEAAERILLPNGRLVIVSFHSLEDSIVKKFFNEKSGRSPGLSRHAVAYAAPGNDEKCSFGLLTKKAVQPSDQEVDRNIRSRSARLRAGFKIEEGTA